MDCCVCIGCLYVYVHVMVVRYVQRDRLAASTTDIRYPWPAQGLEHSCFSEEISPTYPNMIASICQFVCLPVCLSSVCMSSVYLSACLSVSLCVNSQITSSPLCHLIIFLSQPVVSEDGGDGCGKTLASGQIVHWCWKAGWFIIHVPGGEDHMIVT